jgi:acetyl-CoA carboxylase biotin carboxyl carrier protein
MDFEKIKELIKLVDSSSLAFFELESGNDHLKMDKSLNRGLTDNNFNKPNNASTVNNVVSSSTTMNSIEKLEANVLEIDEVRNNEKEVAIEDKNLSVIKSPMVGTFYSSASPESPAFVEVGAAVSKGKVICIIEAMKLMNEIESDYSGIVVERLANDGDMVEYGQPLFKIKGE